MNVLSLFSGIGGLELGLERSGMTVVGQVEIDPFCQRVLAKHWPEVPRHDDVRTAARWWLSRPRPRVDVVAGGFPCQPASDAGRRLAQADERWLWPAMSDVIRSIGPRWVIGENVPGLLRRGLADVHADLERLGYAVRTGSVSACAMGAPHSRERLFVLAHAVGFRRCPWRHDYRGARTPAVELEDRHTAGRGGGWTAEPRVGRGLDGFPAWLDGSGRLSKAHKLLLAYGYAEGATAGEAVRVVRRGHGAPGEERPARGRGGVSSSAVLLAYLRQLEAFCAARDADVASSAAPEAGLRELRAEEVAARPPLRRRPGEQRPGEPADALHALPQLLARLAGQAWAAYRRTDAAPAYWGPGWEDGLDRVTYGAPAGVDRRRVLGNAVVPAVAEHIGRLIMGAAA